MPKSAREPSRIGDLAGEAMPAQDHLEGQAVFRVLVPEGGPRPDVFDSPAGSQGMSGSASMSTLRSLSSVAPAGLDLRGAVGAEVGPDVLPVVGVDEPPVVEWRV